METGWVSGMKVADFLDPRSIVKELGGGNKMEVLEELCRVLVAHDPDLDQDKMVGILLDRERLGSTGVGEGVAIPHGKMENLDRLVACFGRSSQGVEFEAVDKKPVHLFFLLFAPENSAGIHLKALAKISRLLKRPSLREELLSVPESENIYDVLTREDDEDTVQFAGS
jgi:PTS system nitrogen regulatory IIA component